jgi:hypothetical protein
VPVPPIYAVSSPSRLARARDPIGGCEHGAITIAGSGLAGTPAAASAFLDRLLAT